MFINLYCRGSAQACYASDCLATSLYRSDPGSPLLSEKLVKYSALGGTENWRACHSDSLCIPCCLEKCMIGLSTHFGDAQIENRV